MSKDEAEVVTAALSRLDPALLGDPLTRAMHAKVSEYQRNGGVIRVPLPPRVAGKAGA